MNNTGEINNLNQESIIQLFEEYWSVVQPQDKKFICNEKGGIDPLDGMLLHLLTIKKRPNLVIEFSPHHGYSTICIASAMKNIGKPNSFYTFEIKKAVEKPLMNRIENHEVTKFVQVVWGNAIEMIPKTVKSKIDLCFIDSDHRANFAKQYIEKIFSLFNKDCLVGIHDICAHKLGVNTFKTSLRSTGNKSCCGGEEGPIRNWLNKNKKEFCVLHSISGGKHEGANIKTNDNFYEEIKKISGIDFRTKRICPKTLWFNYG